MLNPIQDYTATRYTEPRFADKRSGALVVSLDLELRWGTRDRLSLDRHEQRRLLSARAATIRILGAFREFSVHATWASVGFLFAHSKKDLERFSPSRRPMYTDQALDPYQETLGRDESEDPFHFAPSLIAEIGRQPGQEVATHSFSHFYCREAGQSALEFEGDLRSAVAVAEYSGYSIRSYVFPRNQVNPDYLALLAQAGIFSYRGTPASGVNSGESFRLQQRPDRRLLRLFDNYFGFYGPQVAPWPSGPAPLCIPASRYLRPFSKLRRGLENMQFQRIAGAMRTAAINGEVFHLWWHPEDFALNCDRNLDFLRRILTFYNRCRDEFGMLSLSMNELARASENDLAASRQRVNHRDRTGDLNVSSN